MLLSAHGSWPHTQEDKQRVAEILQAKGYWGECVDVAHP